MAKTKKPGEINPPSTNPEVEPVNPPEPFVPEIKPEIEPEEEPEIAPEEEPELPDEKPDEIEPGKV